MKNATAEVIAFSEPTISVAPGLSLVDAVAKAFDEAREEKGKLVDYVLDIQGMSGRKFRYFLNNVIGYVSNPRYLEIGSWAGSTFCSAIFGNTLKATAIDNWSLFGGPVQHFFMNLANCGGLNARTSVLFEDFRKVDYKALGKFNVYLFDGPHEYQDQYDALTYAWESLTDEFVFIVDDWNWEAVRNGTMDAIRDLGLEVMHQIEVRTTLDNSHPAVGGKESDWHNGYFISVLRKNGASGKA
ncbi:class I SAM-dependent methyltransferase [Phenylobacterium sp.]|uniref:class I SAM-dependent methyltransferase n=1 Tax=Phenylobacterium sp. TaxID=1871053 RepID=UPI002F923DBE